MDQLDFFENTKPDNEIETPMMYGHIKISDPDTGAVYVDRKNAIHYEQMSLAIARALAGLPTGHIFEMHFGSGAATVGQTGGISYFPPRVTGVDADLYVPTYFKVIDRDSLENNDPSRNRMDVKHTADTTYSDIVIICTLDYDEPFGQNTVDDAVNNEGAYVFNEIALKTGGVEPGRGDLLTHVIFHPVQKSANRRLEIRYTLRISMC